MFLKERIDYSNSHKMPIIIKWYDIFENKIYTVEKAIKDILPADIRIKSEWDIELKKYKKHDFFSGENMMDDMTTDIILRNKEYTIAVVDNLKYLNNEVSILAKEGIGAIVSFHEENNILETKAIQAVAHIFGVPSESRKNTEENMGTHCTNSGCVMRKAENPEEWLKLAEEKSGNVLCEECKNDLNNYLS